MNEGSTLNALQTLSLARQLKVGLVSNGDGLRAIGTREAITELVPHITACKPELLRLLAQVIGDAPAPPPASPRLVPTQPTARAEAYHRWRESWQAQAEAYYNHHFTCRYCIAAGKGYGEQCDVGATLWAKYREASENAGGAP